MAGKSASVPAALAPTIEEEVTGIRATIPVMQFQGDASIDVTINSLNFKQPAKFKKQTDIVFTTPSYFEMVPFEWQAGAGPQSLTKPFSVVLTASRARQYFNNLSFTEMIGMEILYGDKVTAVVTGIVKDLDEITDFTAREFISYSTIAKTSLQQDFMMDIWNDWMAYSKTYVILKSGVHSSTVARQINTLLKKYHPNRNHDARFTIILSLQPLNDIHFNTSYASFGQRTAHKSTLYGLIAIGLFLLLLACMNFINLSTAQASRRAKEIGIRKTIGSVKNQIVMQFLCETFSITLLALAVSISLVPFLLELFSDFIPNGVEFNLLNDWYAILFLIALVSIVSLLSGLYPAFVLAGLRPVSILKNSFSGGGLTRSAGFRKILTVSQFTIAQIFIIAAFMVGKQIHFSLHQELGFRKASIVTFDVPQGNPANHHHYLANTIKNIPGVQKVSLGFSPPAMQGGAYTNVSFNSGKEEKNIPVQIRFGDEHYLSLYNIRLAAGRNVRGGEHVNELLINEAYAQELGFQNPEDALGKEISQPNGPSTPIVGVMRNFHESSFHRMISPLLFRAANDGSTFHVALAAGGTASEGWIPLLTEIKKAYIQIYPEHDFIYNFFDDTIAGFYQAEQNIGELLNWATGLSVFISCLGLLGLVIYTSETRRKEIGIRKILGATVGTIVSLLSKEFIRLVFVAFCIATPLSWWAVNRWLEGFAYKTQLDWWVFLMGGLLLMFVAFATLSFQTVRTASANPVDSLRNE